VRLDVGENEMLRVLLYDDGDAEALADRAVSAVAADEPIRLDGRDVLAPSQLSADRRVIRLDRNQFAVAFDFHAAPAEVRGENALGAVLRHAEDIRVAGIEYAKLNLRNRGAIAADLDAADPLSGRQKIIDDAREIKAFERPRMDRNGLRMD
jgi:hypothetical protein